MTLREHLEAIRDRNAGDSTDNHLGDARDYAAAVAALAILDAAERAYMIGNEYGDYCCDCGAAIRLHAHCPGRDDDIHGRFVPDPEPTS